MEDQKQKQKQELTKEQWQKHVVEAITQTTHDFAQTEIPASRREEWLIGFFSFDKENENNNPETKSAFCESVAEGIAHDEKWAGTTIEYLLFLKKTTGFKHGFLIWCDFIEAWLSAEEKIDEQHTQNLSKN